jgi:RHS repeat-associated protein
MLTIKTTLKNSCKAAFVVFALLLTAHSHTIAQTYVSSTPITAPLQPGQYYNNSSITLGSGFSANGANGNFQFYIPTDCSPLTTTPTASMNYIMTSAPRMPNYVPGNAGYGTCDVMQTIQYFDGLGRPIQTVQVKGSPMGNDVVQPQAYDQFGREAVKYLPYVNQSSVISDGSYKTNALTAGAGVSNYYNPTGNGISGSQQTNGVVVNPNPYAQTVFEPSPLNRVVEQGAPGAPWQPVPGTTAGYTVKTIYAVNDGVKYKVTLYTVNIDGAGNRTLVYSASNPSYGAGQLYVTVTQNENWPTTQNIDQRLNTTEEYKDKEGHVLLKRTYNLTGTSTIQVLSTYYVYDNLGNLCFVLPPAALPDAGLTSAGNQTTLNNFCYQYCYDSRNRMTSKQLPGKGVEYMVYNQLDQPVLSQDASQRLTNQWTVTKYDALGRVIVTGLWNAGSAIAQATLQNSIYAGAQWDTRDYTNNTTTNPTGYVISSYPQLSKALTINFYDDYTFTGQPTAFVAPSGASTNTLGLPTAIKTTVLNTINNTTPDMLWSVMYYDNLGRNIQTYKRHYLGGTLNAANYDAIVTTYNFTNAPTTVTRKHWNLNSTSAPLVTVANTYLYDHVGRKLKTWETISNSSSAGTPALISQMVYNEIGQVMNKNLHSTDSVHFLQAIAYNYNERGWLLGSSAPLFAMQLQYNLNPAGVTGFTAQYNGNIASQVYTSSGQGTKNFNYTYDYLNRLISGTGSDSFSETGISYDLNGNINTLNRYQAGTPIDQLGYTYNSTNQVQTVVDGSGNSSGLTNGTTTYTWDGTNGNLISSTNTTNTSQNKSFTYNLLNLPQTAVTAIGGTDTYTYDATGQKLRKVNVNGANTVMTDYISGIQYKNNSTAIDFIQTEEGKAVPNTGGYDYYYYLGDNLGNTRVTFDTQSGTATALQTDDYYPFGLEISRGTITSPKNEYLYNKKELQEELQQYDYGARFYDPVIARWTTIDPLAELSRRWTPYNYVENDPIRMTDPDGMACAGCHFDPNINPDTGQPLDPDYAKNHPGDAPKPQFDPSKFKDQLGWRRGESTNDGFGPGFGVGIGLPPELLSRVKNVPKWLWVVDGLDQEVPVLDVITDAATLYYLLHDKPAILLMKGERGQTGGAGGTNNPFKKLKPDPKKPGNVLETDNQTGKTISKPQPPGFKEWWNAKHPNNRI